MDLQNNFGRKYYNEARVSQSIHTLLTRMANLASTYKDQGRRKEDEELQAKEFFPPTCY